MTKPTRRAARARLTARIFEDLAADWEDPMPNDARGRSKGQVALALLLREDPGAYVKAMLSVLPKEIQIETFMGDVGDDELDAMIEQLRAKIIEAKANPPLQLIEAKPVEKVGT